MTVNYVSMLLAIIFSGICLSATMVGFWLTTRNDDFKLTWSAGVMLLVAHVTAYGFYAYNPHPLLGASVVALLPMGLSVLYAAARQFFDEKASFRRAAVTSAVCLGLSLPPLALGYDGIAFIVQNLAAAVLLAMSGLVYLHSRKDAPTALVLMSGLYFAVAISFALCGLTLLVNAQWTIGGVPENWAERLNIVVSIVGLTGGGALSIALDQSRLAQKLRADALEDPLTGLLNRRGLVERCGNWAFDDKSAVALFDLDHFKQVNDMHGHAVGDAVLTRFAAILERLCRPQDFAVRLGGEEFALVMPMVTGDEAVRAARAACREFHLESFRGTNGRFRCSASAGLAFGGEGRSGLDDILQNADRALYAAKAAGRNRLVVDHLLDVTLGQASARQGRDGRTGADEVSVA